MIASWRVQFACGRISRGRAAAAAVPCRTDPRAERGSRGELSHQNLRVHLAHRESRWEPDHRASAAGALLDAGRNAREGARLRAPGWNGQDAEPQLAIAVDGRA